MGAEVRTAYALDFRRDRPELPPTGMNLCTLISFDARPDAEFAFRERLTSPTVGSIP